MGPFSVNRETVTRAAPELLVSQTLAWLSSPRPLAVVMTLPAIPRDGLSSRDNTEPHQPDTTTVTGAFTAGRGGVFAVTLSGDMDLTLVPELLDLVGRFEAGRSAVATVDLRAATCFGSTGVNFLVHLRQIAHARGGSVTLLGASPSCRRILAIVGLDTAFDMAA